MLGFIVINPSDYRKDDFNINSLNCSRWQVDFYQLNEDYDPLDEYDDQYFIGTLHFTAYNIGKETPKEAYKALIKQLNFLLLASEQTQTNTYNNNFTIESLTDQDNETEEPFRGFVYSYGDIMQNHCKSSICFYQLITNKKVVLSINNIDLLHDINYLYYSSLKWLYYPFTEETNTKCLNNLYEFNRLLAGKVELKEFLPYSQY